MNILVAGGSGFVGRKIIENLGKHNFINISKTHKNELCHNNIVLDLSQSIEHFNLQFTKQVDLIINCIDSNETKEDKIRQDIVSTVSGLLHIAKNNNISKIIHFSINDAESVKDSYQKAKILAERAVENSNLDYIILRLSPVFGDDSKLERLITKLTSKNKNMPQIGAAEDKLAPIHYKDVVENVKQALKKSTKWNETYSLCGPEYMNFKELVQRHTNKDIKQKKYIKFLEKLYVNSLIDPDTKRFIIGLVNSYYKDASYIHTPIVRAKIFY